MKFSATRLAALYRHSTPKLFGVWSDCVVTKAYHFFVEGGAQCFRTICGIIWHISWTKEQTVHSWVGSCASHYSPRPRSALLEKVQPNVLPVKIGIFSFSQPLVLSWVRMVYIQKKSDSLLEIYSFHLSWAMPPCLTALRFHHLSWFSSRPN